MIARLSRWFDRMKSPRGETGALSLHPPESEGGSDHAHTHEHFDGIVHVHEHGHGDHDHRHDHDVHHPDTKV